MSTWRWGCSRAASALISWRRSSSPDERVVVGELADAVAAHEVGAAVADVGERGAAFSGEQATSVVPMPASSGRSRAVV